MSKNEFIKNELKNTKIFMGNYITSDGINHEKSYFKVDSSQDIFDHVEKHKIYITSGVVLNDIYMSVPGMGKIKKKLVPEKPHDLFVISQVLDNIKKGNLAPLSYLRFEYKDFEPMQFVATDSLVEEYNKTYQQWLDNTKVLSTDLINKNDENNKESGRIQNEKK